MKRGKVTTEEKKEARCWADHRHHRLRRAAGCDLIVEAVFEDPKVKAEVTKNGSPPPPMM
jgi:3-hydroxyacyl-CoA dehydrogenase/enoyl-CoA hydratase/3-hydroxybutyryl-CoA epimerase